jgi:hypothetical protein
MNWGYKILFVYIAFVVGILVMVFKSSTQKVDLVTTDYYAKELKYQDRIDAVKRTQALSAPVTHEITDQQILLHFPKEFAGKQLSGSILLYCPSDESKDLQKNFFTATGNISVQLPAAQKGAYELQVNWQSDSIAYYFENKLVL